MAPKAKKSWFDVQTAIMTISMAAVLVLWNLFAGPDREAALRKAAEELANQPEPVVAPPVQQPAQQSAQMQPAQVVIPQPGEKIMLGGAAPPDRPGLAQRAPPPDPRGHPPHAHARRRGERDQEGGPEADGMVRVHDTHSVPQTRRGPDVWGVRAAGRLGAGISA